MKKKLFGRGGRQGQLEDLCREADRGGDLRDVDPELQQEFAADQQLRQQLGRFASESAPAAPSAGRATFLSAVARQRSKSQEDERRPMIGQLLGGRGLALLAAAGIFAGGAVTVGASGGVGNAAGNANDVLATLHVPHTGHGHGNGNAGSGGPQASGTPAAEGTQRAVEGIPTENPQHHPADANGICDKGETIVKTTPSGVAVNVPCQAGQGKGISHGDKTPGADATAEANATEPQGGQGNGNSHRDKTPGAGETPAANATEPNGHAGGADHTPVPLPTQASSHASEGAGNASGRGNASGH
jgi:hypothetical protein